MLSRGLVASLLATIAANLPVFLTGGLAVQMGDALGFGATALGVAIGVFWAVGAASSAAAGRLVERVGPERSLRWAAGVSAVVLLAIAAAARSYLLLLPLMVVGGLANAWSQPAANVYLVRIVPHHRLGLALGLQKSAIPAAALLGGLAVPAVALTVGWRWAFVAGAAFAAVAAARLPRAPLPAAGGPGGPATRRGTPDVPARHLLVLALGVGLGSAASNSLSAFLVLAGVDAGLGEAVAGLMLTLGSIAGIGVRLLVGARADRTPGRALPVMAAMFVVASGAYLVLAAGRAGPFLVATPVAFATAYAWPGLFHLAVIRANPSAPGAATGLAMTGTLLGAVGGPILFGAIAENGSYGMAWVTGAAFLLAAAAVVWGVRAHILAPRPTPA